MTNRKKDLVREFFCFPDQVHILFIDRTRYSS